MQNTKGGKNKHKGERTRVRCATENGGQIREENTQDAGFLGERKGKRGRSKDGDLERGSKEGCTCENAKVTHIQQKCTILTYLGVAPRGDPIGESMGVEE